MATPKKTKSKKPIKPPARVPVESAWRITRASLKLVWHFRLVFSAILLIYAVVYFILVEGLSIPSSASSLSSQFNLLFHGRFSDLASSLKVFSTLISNNATASSPGASAYQVFLVVIVSLAIIWSLRQIYNNLNFRARDSYYKGMYALIPFILILLLIAVELLPLVLATTLYNIVINGSVANGLLVDIIWIIPLAAMALLSLYLVSSSIFAVYIVTLPDMTPVKALKSANQLVKKRRLLVMRKVLYLPLAMLVVAAVILLPFILVFPAAAEPIFIILVLISIVFSHTYLYNLYRELIK